MADIQRTNPSAEQKTNVAGTPDLAATVDASLNVAFSRSVSVFAVESVRTASDNITDGGFGYSTPLDTPERSTLFIVKGSFYTAPDKDDQRVAIPRDNVESLARSFSEKYMRQQDPTQEPGKTYTLITTPSDADKAEYSSRNDSETRTVRALSEQELSVFIETFQKHNQELLPTVQEEQRRAALPRNPALR